jgi:hypothetical protein
MSSGSIVCGTSSGLTGRLPSQIGQWTDLESLSVSANALTEALLIEIGQLTKLKYLMMNSGCLIQIDQFAHLSRFSQCSDWKFAISDWANDLYANIFRALQ